LRPTVYKNQKRNAFGQQQSSKKINELAQTVADLNRNLQDY